MFETWFIAWTRIHQKPSTQSLIFSKTWQNWASQNRNPQRKHSRSNSLTPSSKNTCKGYISTAQFHEYICLPYKNLASHLATHLNRQLPEKAHAKIRSARTTLLPQLIKSSRQSSWRKERRAFDVWCTFGCVFFVETTHFSLTPHWWCRIQFWSHNFTPIHSTA